MVTMKDIAAKLGISLSTVSKGLSGASDISEDLRQSILDAAVEMGYKPKKQKKDYRKKLCIFIENIEYASPDSFGYELILGFRQMADREGFDIVVVPINTAFQSRERFDTYMLRNGFAGAFVIGLSLYDEWMHQLKETTVPCVLFDNYISTNPNVGYVGTDSFEGIDLCVSHLARLGHTKIAFLNGIAGSMVTADRHEAFLQSMQRNHLIVDEKLAVFGTYEADCAKYYVPGFLTKGVTAIVCGSDTIADGVIGECIRKGVRVPEDISVTGFDDLPLASTLQPPLTSVWQDRISLGKCGFVVLSALMHKIPIGKAVLRPRLITRASSAYL
ncbi:MAG: LacI family DNA-binding transcriptional regulator, partial [Lachnospiraceae bacterium]|nr:LacI family DNA-binding transcriptional regulator [Lachnospiraceae bacterium]